MGTNYYWLSEPCPTCNHSQGKLHIGKSSWGWCFELHVIPDLGLTSLEAWEVKFASGGVLENEYLERISISELYRIITKRDHPTPEITDWTVMRYRDEAHFHASNHSERGPFGLLRHAVSADGWHCIGHGKGTYDYIVGDFS